MKMAMTALAVVFLAQAGTALAQPGDRGGERGGWRHDGQGPRTEASQDGAQRNNGGGQWRGGGGGEWRGRGGQAPEAQRPAEAPRAAAPAAAPQAPPAAEPRWRDRGGRVPGDSVGRPGPWVQQNRGADPSLAERPPQARTDGDRRDGQRAEGQRHEGQRPDGQRYDGQRRDGQRYDGDRRDGQRYDNDRPDNDRRDGNRYDDRRGDRQASDRHDWGRRDWNRYDRRDWDNHRDYRRWERGRYPTVYFSSHRYNYAWRPPVGFYVRAWTFGEFLPRGWYGPDYYIVDPWTFDLPLPPPGFDWVRVGYDALLIDSYTGRIEQVVRNVFW